MQFNVTSISSNTIPIINIYRKTTLTPRDSIEKKKFNITLHDLEPLGIEVLSPTSISVLVKGTNIKGSGEIHYHNVDNIRKITGINVNEVKTMTIPGKGELFLSVDNILNTLGDIPFNFQVIINIGDANSYIITPAFDVRTNKIHDRTITVESDYNKALLANSENGMLLVSENVRIFMPKCKYIKTPISPIAVLSLHEKILYEYNKLSGLDINAPKQIDRPRRNFVLVSSRNQQAGLMSAGATMLDTAPKNSKGYFGPGWGIFHEYGHLYDQRWIFREIWNNMYSKTMAEKTIGFKWLWGSDRIDYENRKIIPFYENYLTKGNFTESDFNYSTGLYFFVTLEEVLGPNFVSTMTTFHRNNYTLDTRHNYVAYALAANYGVNIIPYMELYGYQIFDKNIIDFVVDNSTSTLMYIPKNPAFSKYSTISITPTVKYLYASATPKLIGICGANAEVSLTVNTNHYTFNSDSKGKFTFNVPEALDSTSVVKINSIEPGKSVSPTKTLLIKTILADNTFEFHGDKNDLIATIKFDVNNKTLKVSSTGTIAHSYFGTKEYFSASLYDTNKNLVATSTVLGNANANEFGMALNNKKFDYGYYFKLTHQEPARLVLQGNILSKPNTKNPFNFSAINLNNVFLYIDYNGIKYSLVQI